MTAPLGPPEGLVIDGREHGGRLGGRGPEEWIVSINLSPKNRTDVSVRSTVIYAVPLHWPHHHLRVSTPLSTEGTQHRLAHQKSRGRGPSRQGHLSAVYTERRHAGKS